MLRPLHEPNSRRSICRASRAILRNVLRNVGFEQILDAVGHHPFSRITLLGGEVTSLKPGGEDLLCRYPRLMKGHPTERADCVFSQLGTCTSRPEQDDAGFLAVRWRTILAWDSKSHGGTMPEGYLHLTCEQRCQIYALLQSGHSQAHIARKIGVTGRTD